MEWNDGEHVLAEGDCMLMRGPAGFPGRLYLTNERIFYQPTRLQRALGVSSHFIPLKNITHTERRTLDGRVRIQARRVVLEFDGGGTRAVWERLQAELGVDSGPFRKDERVVADLPGEWFLGDRLAVGGQVLLTQRQVRFAPRALERLIARDDISLYFDDIESFELEEGRHRIRLRGKDHEVHRLGGAAVGPAWAALTTFRTRAEHGLPPDTGYFEVWPGELLRSPLSHAARFVLTSHHLFVVIHGALDGLAGLPFISALPLAKVDRIDRRGTVEKRVTITTPEGALSVTTERFDTFYDDLLLCAGDAAGPVAPTARAEGVGEAMLQQVLAPWAELGVREMLGERTALLSPALATNPTGHSRRGFLLVSDGAVAWLPEGGPAAGPPQIFPMGSMPRAVGGSLADEIRFVLRDGRYRFHCSGGALTHRAFWEALFDIQEERHRAWLAANPEAEVEEEEAETEPKERDSNRRSSYRMRVPIIDLEGVLARRAPVLPPPPLEGENATQRNEVGEPPSGADSSAETLLAGGIEPVPEVPFQLWRLIDLSLGGAQIEATEPADQAVRLDLKLGTSEELPVVRSAVAHVRKVRGKPLWRYGIRFEDNEFPVQQHIFDSWQELQRVEAALRHEEDD